MKTIEAGEDYWIYVTESMKGDINGICLSCKKCTWEVDLNKLDTLLDINDELIHHFHHCFEWSNREARTDGS